MGSEVTAGRLRQALARHVALQECVGILRGWPGCSADRARRELRSGCGVRGEEREAAWLVALLDDEVRDGELGSSNVVRMTSSGGSALPQ